MKRRLILLSGVALLLAGCDPEITTSPLVPPSPLPSNSASISISGRAEAKTYSPHEVKLKDTLHSIEDDLHYNTQILPSEGNVNLLVIPVLIPGYSTFSYAGFDEDMSDSERLDQVKNDLESAFFADEEETGFQSVSSYYREASLGKLNLNGEVTDWFDLEAELGITTPSEITINATYEIVEAAVQWAFGEQGYVSSQYDSDADGFYDGIWFIYSAEDYAKGGPLTDDRNYWAYTSWGNQDKEGDPSRRLYYYNLFGWASYDFMYEGYGKGKIDAHTYIHETGHFLGLNDYYSERMMYNPVGKIDMMDGNIGDLNSYSKLLLGWANPYIVYGNAELTIGDIDNQCVIVMPDGAEETEEFDPFSEYLLLDLYSPTGFLKQEINNPIPDRPAIPETTGIRIYHIDNRRFKTHYDEGIGDYVTVSDDGTALKDNEHYILPITNSIGFNQYQSALNLDPSVYPYDEIRLIEKDKDNTFSSGGYQIESTYFYEGDTFKVEDYADFFLNAPYLDNGESMSALIGITNIEEVDQ